MLLLELAADSGSSAAPPLVQSWGVWLVIFSSGVRHPLGSCLPRFLLFLGSVVSGVVFYPIHVYLFSSVNPPVGVRGVAVLPHLLLFHFLSF